MPSTLFNTIEVYYVVNTFVRVFVLQFYVRFECYMCLLVMKNQIG